MSLFACSNLASNEQNSKLPPPQAVQKLWNNVGDANGRDFIKRTNVAQIWKSSEKKSS